MLPAKIAVDADSGGAVNDDVNGLVTVSKMCWQTGRMKAAFGMSTCQAGPEKQKIMGAFTSAGSLRRASWGQGIIPLLEVQTRLLRGTAPSDSMQDWHHHLVSRLATMSTLQ